jgi:hypothetical protein
MTILGEPLMITKTSRIVPFATAWRKKLDARVEVSA